MTALDRRTFLARTAAGGAAVYLLGRPPSTTAAAVATAKLPRGGSFTQAVACGQPAPDAISLWTRLEGFDRAVPVAWEISPDPDFRRTLLRGTAIADPRADHTARVRVKSPKLKPGERYHYRFATKTVDSPVGRMRTAPAPDSNDPLRIGFFSCQEFIAGFYHAHRDLAAQDDLDLVVCLGDYIYEQAYADTASRNQPVRADDSVPTDGEAQTLADYRAKYTWYHTDPNLIAVRLAHPLMAIWDDHEVEDNYAADKPGGAATNRRVPFPERRAAGYRAWAENMPRATLETTKTYGSVRLGPAELFLLDTRQFRGDQPCSPDDSALSQPCPPATTDDPTRTLLGATQKAWLKGALARSRAPWKVVANQVMIMSLDGAPGVTLNTDSWDGYGADRREVIDWIGSQGIENVSFVTGDIHTYFAGSVTHDGRASTRRPLDDPIHGPARATEFVGGAVTSPGIVDRVAGTEPERIAEAAPVDAAVLGANPHMVFSNQVYKGYAIVEVAPEKLSVEYRAVRDTRLATSSVFTLRRFHVDGGAPIVVDDGGPLPLPDPVPPTEVPGTVPGAVQSVIDELGGALGR
jgi:alkaline phosphatase D